MELINIRQTENGLQTVLATDLYNFLESKTGKSRLYRYPAPTGNTSPAQLDKENKNRKSNRHTENRPACGAYYHKGKETD